MKKELLSRINPLTYNEKIDLALTVLHNGEISGFKHHTLADYLFTYKTELFEDLSETTTSEYAEINSIKQVVMSMIFPHPAYTPEKNDSSPGEMVEINKKDYNPLGLNDKSQGRVLRAVNDSGTEIGWFTTKELDEPIEHIQKKFDDAVNQTLSDGIEQFEEIIDNLNLDWNIKLLRPTEVKLNF
jgi:hypothetical protein